MPTGSEFEQAAAAFARIGADLAQLAQTASKVDVSAVIVGGKLGALVPERLEHAVRVAGAACRAVGVAETTCLERAAIIAAYERDLAAYLVAQASYEAARVAHAARAVAMTAAAATTAAASEQALLRAIAGADAELAPEPAPITVAPVPAPVAPLGPPPIPPKAPPSWADVQRI